MNDVALPEFSVIESSLRRTTERLTREIAEPQKHAPDWSEFEWAVARAVSSMHGISALLATRLQWNGPPSWNDFLHEQRVQTLACYDRVGHVLARLDRAARTAKLPYVALKGSAIREIGLHHPGDRPMGDIDLLVQPSDFEHTKAIINSVGYRTAHLARRHQTFLPVSASQPHSYGEHIDNPLRIELHARISERLPFDEVDITAQVWPADAQPGNNAYPNLVAMVRHLLLHVCGNLRANAMRFLQIYEIALLVRRLSSSDWATLMGPDPRTNAWWQYPPLSLAARYMPGSVPESVLAEAATACHRRLRLRAERWEVSDVSWSNLRIRALPGIEWARTPVEGIRFAKNRVAPSRSALSELRDGVESSPSLRSSSWYKSSQLRRIFVWSFGRPPRVQTMASVRAALKAGKA
jgi:hypothetical protein